MLSPSLVLSNTLHVPYLFHKLLLVSQVKKKIKTRIVMCSLISPFVSFRLCLRAWREDEEGAKMKRELRGMRNI